MEKQTPWFYCDSKLVPVGNCMERVELGWNHVRITWLFLHVRWTVEQKLIFHLALRVIKR